jgi:hypothetical protein
MQQALANRDLELARSQRTLAEVTAEAAELRRVHQREGINMDYLKNIVVQYMTFPVQSSEKLSLVPVIAMLLQFSRKELADVQRANQEAAASVMSVVSIWSSPSPSGSGLAPSSMGIPSSRTPKEIKRPMATPVSASTSTSTALSSFARGGPSSSSSSFRGGGLSPPRRGMGTAVGTGSADAKGDVVNPRMEASATFSGKSDRSAISSSDDSQNDEKMGASFDLPTSLSRGVLSDSDRVRHTPLDPIP